MKLNVSNDIYRNAIDGTSNWYFSFLLWTNVLDAMIQQNELQI